jgi:signal transduction histidine kinase
MSARWSLRRYSELGEWSNIKDIPARTSKRVSKTMDAEMAYTPHIANVETPVSQSVEDRMQFHAVLRKAVGAIASETELSRLAERFLLEVTTIAGAVMGGFALCINTTQLRQIAHVEYGTVLPESVWNNSQHIDPASGAVRDPTGWMAEHIKGPELFVRTDQPHPLMPLPYLAFLRVNAIKFQWSLPMWQGDAVLGVFTLCFQQNELTDATADLVRSLAHQAALAIRLTRVAEALRRSEIELARNDERELLTQRRVDDLAAQHLTLRKAMESIAAETDTQALVEKFLLEVTSIAGAVFGGLSMRVGANHFQQIAHVQNGAIVPASFWRIATHVDAETGELRDPVGRMAELLKGKELFMLTEPRHRLIPPDHLPYLRASNVQLQWSLPMCLGNEVIGGFTLGFSRRELTEHTIDLVRAFAHQITLATRLNRASEDIRRQEAQMIVAREREQAAQRQAQELLVSNETLRVEVGERQKAERIARGRTSALTQVLNGLTGAHNLDQTMNALLTTVVTTLSASGGILWRYEHGSGTVVAEAISGAVSLPGVNLGSTAHPRIRLETALIDRLNMQGGLHYDTELGIGDEVLDARMKLFLRDGITRILSFPIRFREQSLGAFSIYNPQTAINHDDNIYMASALADQAALAMQLRTLANAEKEEERAAAIDAERTRFARDMHDSLAQGLSGIVIHLQAAQRSLYAEKMTEHIDYAIDAAKQGLVDIRRAVRALRNESRDGDLPAGIGALLKSIFIGSPVLYDVQSYGSRFLLAESIQEEILRIVQEAATNVLTHSGATQFQAILNYTGADFSLELIDNGRGFHPNAVHDGFGVIGIKERAQQITSDFSFDSRPGGPTRIALCLKSCAAVQLGTNANVL